MKVYDEISSQAVDFQRIKKSPELNLPRYVCIVQEEVHLLIPTEELNIKLRACIGGGLGNLTI